MVTRGAGDTGPLVAVAPGLIMPAAIMARPSRVELLISLRLSLMSWAAAPEF